MDENKIIGVCRNHYLPPAAPVLGRQEMEERTGQRGFPLCNSPTLEIVCAKLSARLGMQCADSALPARASPLSVISPFRSHARDADEGATVGGSCRSCPKRGRNWTIAAHEVKRRPRIFIRALDGVVCLATRVGSLRAEPLGVSFVQPFLHEQKRAGRRRQKLPYKLQLAIITR